MKDREQCLQTLKELMKHVDDIQDTFCLWKLLRFITGCSLRDFWQTVSLLLQCTFTAVHFQVMINTGELYLAKTSIPSLYKDWIEADVEAATLKGDDTINLENAQLPVEGQAWFALVRTQVSLAEGKVEDARKHIQAARYNTVLVNCPFFFPCL